MSPCLAVLQETFLRTFSKIQLCYSSFFAGGASVHWHMLQPDSYKYFARAISLSGVLNPDWSQIVQDKQRKKVAAGLKNLRCSVSNPTPEQVNEFLLTLSTDQIHCLLPEGPISRGRFLPVDTFNCEEPSKKFMARNKPLIFGITAEEGKMFPDFLFPRDDKSQPTKYYYHLCVEKF